MDTMGITVYLEITSFPRIGPFLFSGCKPIPSNPHPQTSNHIEFEKHLLKKLSLWTSPSPQTYPVLHEDDWRRLRTPSPELLVMSLRVLKEGLNVLVSRFRV